MTAENEEKDIKGVNKDASNKDTDISDEEMERDEKIKWDKQIQETTRNCGRY